MQRTVPPFRADHVGSLLRPAALKEARARRANGEISDVELHAAEDAAILDVIAKQAAVGLQSATDGEFRRAMWHFDFLERLDGVEWFQAITGSRSRAASKPRRRVCASSARSGSSSHPMLEHFRFLAGHTRAIPKMTIPSPSVVHFPGWPEGGK